MSITLQNRSQANATVFGISSNTYTADADGVITAVDQHDVPPLLAAGWRYLTASDNDTATGLPSTGIQISLLSARNTDGSVIAAAAASGKFGCSITLGTSEQLVGEAAESNTKTDDALFEFRIPDNYVAGQNLTATVNAQVAGTGTPGTKTVQVKAYAKANAGTLGANIGPGTATAITTSAADYAFTITGTGLVPGQMLVLELESVLQETGGTATVTTEINSLRVS
jgi:hypothetical protein